MVSASSSWLSSCPDFPQWWTMIYKHKIDKPFHAQGAFDWNVLSQQQKETRTYIYVCLAFTKVSNVLVVPVFNNYSQDWPSWEWKWGSGRLWKQRWAQPLGSAVPISAWKITTSALDTLQGQHLQGAGTITVCVLPLGLYFSMPSS